MVFNIGYQKNHFCSFGSITKAKGTFIVMRALIVAKSNSKNILKLNMDSNVQATSLFSIAQHHFFTLNVPCHVPLHSKTTWGNCHLCLARRVLVATQVLFSSMWYLVTCWNPNPRMTY
jgi:hypothetical protein